MIDVEDELCEYSFSIESNPTLPFFQLETTGPVKLKLGRVYLPISNNDSKQRTLPANSELGLLYVNRLKKLQTFAI